MKKKQLLQYSSASNLHDVEIISFDIDYVEIILNMHFSLIERNYSQIRN
jgi:hypothetical protein